MKLADWARSVKLRDECCVLCSSFDQLQAHHVYPRAVFPSMSSCIDNGLTLCTTCHRAWHLDSKKWRAWWSAHWPERARKIKAMLPMEARR